MNIKFCIFIILLTFQITFQQGDQNVPQAQNIENKQSNQKNAQTNEQKIIKNGQDRSKLNNRQKNAKYQQVKRKRAERENQRRQEMGSTTAPEKQARQTELNQTSRVIRQQVRQRGEIMNQFEEQGLSANNWQVTTFELQKNPAQFIISYLVKMDIIIQFRCFIDEEGVLKQVSDINTAGPVKVQLMKKKNNGFVSHSEFYFLGHIKFQAQKNEEYLMRFSTVGVKKLIQIQLPKKVSLIQLGGFYSPQKADKHAQDIQISFKRVKQSLAQLRKIKALEYVNSLHMEKHIKRYSTFQFVEMVVIIIFTLVQLELIKRLFANNSIL